jgi:hypothetical protein
MTREVRMTEQDNVDWLDAPPAMLQRLLLLALLMAPPGVLGSLMVAQHTPPAAPRLARSAPVIGASAGLIAEPLIENSAETDAPGGAGGLGKANIFDGVAGQPSQERNPLPSRAHDWQIDRHDGYGAYSQVMPQE